MPRFRNRDAKKVAELARLLVALDQQARTVRPAPAPRPRFSLGPGR